MLLSFRRRQVTARELEPLHGCDVTGSAWVRPALPYRCPAPTSRLLPRHGRRDGLAGYPAAVRRERSASPALPGLGRRVPRRPRPRRRPAPQRRALLVEA